MRYGSKAAALTVCLLGILPALATAGPFADDMAKCLVKSTSESDRADLVRWMFSAMALHPELASMSTVSAKQRHEFDAKAAQLFSRLLFESCKTETQDAVQNEGALTIQYAFQILGQVATRGLIADPHVNAAMQAFGKEIDQQKLKQLMALANQK